MANRMYFGATVNGAFDIYRLAENDGMSRVDLPDGVTGGLVSIGGTTPTFVTSTDGGELTLVRLAPSGLFSVVQDSGGAPIVIDDLAQVTTDGDLIYFSGSVAGDLAIWRRVLDGGLTKVTDLLTPGKMFEFNDGKLWIDATGAAFAITPDGQIERMAELRTSKFAPNDNDSFNFDIVDAVVTDSFVAGGNVFYNYSRDSGAAFISNEDVLDAVTPAGDIISAGLGGRTLVDGAEIYTIIDNIFTEGPLLGHRNAETGASILSVRLGDDRFGDRASDSVVFNGLLHVILNDNIVRVEANGSRTVVVDGDSSASGVTQISALSVFDGALYFSADTFGPGGLGRELYKFESDTVSLVFNLTPGQDGSSIGRSIGIFDTGDEGGTPIFSSTDTGGNDDDDVIDGTNDDDNLSGLGGDDIINGNDGNDILNGNEGNDRLTGGQGVDTLRGGEGDDFYDLGFDQTDIVIENPDEGIDTIRSTRPIVLPDNVENLIYEGIRTATGNELDNEMTGNRFFQTFEGLGGDDRIDGGEGEDVLLGGNGDDTLIGGAGDFRDKLVGGNGNDTIEAGGGNDRAFGNSGNDIINGGDGDDIIAGQSGADQIDAGAGDDAVDGGFHNDVINGGDGDDRLVGNGGFDEIDGGAGDDLIFGGAHADIIRGGDGDDRILGQSLGDDMTGGAGGDEFFITPGAGDDIIRDFETGFTSSEVVNLARLGFSSGSAALAAVQDDANGNAVLTYTGGSITFDGLATSDLSIHDFHVAAGGAVGTGLADSIFGTAGNDKLIGNGGDDEIRAGGGVDAVFGGAGADFLVGQSGDDLVRGGAGNDRAFGNSGNDRVIGDAGDDQLFGQSGDDLLAGAGGNDRLDGGFNNDQLFGNQGDDVLNGGDGDDVLTGGAGNDQFTGGAGSDRHVAGSGLDVLTDFQSGPGGDVLDLRIFGFTDLDAVLAITSNNALGAVIQIADGDTINILGVAAGDLNDTNVLV